MTRAHAARWATGLVVLLASASLAGCGGGGGSSSASSATACSAVGYVKESASQDGISGATVTIESHSATTDAEGRYQMTGLSVGVQTRSISASGYSEYADTVTVDTGVNTYPDVLLVDAPPPPPPP